MPLYSYVIIDSNGKEKKGLVEGDNKNSVKTRLQKNGCFVTEIKEKSSREGIGIDSLKELFSRLGRKASPGEIASMTRLLATLQKAHIPLVEAVDAVARQQENQYLKESMLIIKNKMQEGYSFSRAARDFPDIFSDLYRSMIEAGEESGATDKVLLRLADFLESQVDLRNKVKSAMTYPAILLIVAVLVVGVLFTVVIPKLSKMFEDIEMALPFQTRVLLWLSDFVGSWWWLILMILIAGFVAFKRYIRTEEGHLKWDRFLITMPIFGSVNRKIAISRFSKTLATLLDSGVSILLAFDIVKRVIGNRILENAISNARENIKEGESVAVPLKRSGEFPPIVIQMISIGEKSGDIEEMLETLAESYEKEVGYTLEKLTSMIEPVMIVLLALVVGFIVFAVVMPIIQINDVVA
ncbi:MAG: type II secretion system inner membrane protein GspF [bacterium]